MQANIYSRVFQSLEKLIKVNEMSGNISHLRKMHFQAALSCLRSGTIKPAKVSACAVF